MNKVTLSLIIVTCGALLVKSFLNPMNIPESFVFLGCLGYLGFIKYSEHNAATKIEKNYEERLKSIENKLMFLTSGAVVNNKRR